jgi:hypothetical protein
MGALIFVVVIAEWAGLAFLGKRLARAMSNPDAWPLPLILGGVFGVIVMLLASVTEPGAGLRSRAL